MGEGLLALTGIVVGWGLTWVTTRQQNKRQDRQQLHQEQRQDHQQWNQHRISAYTTAWLRIGTVQESLEDLARTSRRGPAAIVRLVRKTVPMDQAIREAGEALTVIRFIGSTDVVAAADQCFDVLAELADAAGAERVDPDALTALKDRMNAGRHHLVDVARAELDVDVRIRGLNQLPPA